MLAKKRQAAQPGGLLFYGVQFWQGVYPAESAASRLGKGTLLLSFMRVTEPQLL